jgi:hypothetical protein
MSMSTYVEAFRPPDEQFKKMLEIYNQCIELGVSIPKEVVAFFDGEPPSPTGVKVNLNRLKGVVSPYRDESREGVEINLDKLPKDIKILRFVNSW